VTATQPPIIDFDEREHVYRVDGVVRPSVTQILAGVGLIDPRWFTPESRARGQAVHAACHYLDEGDLDLASVAPEIEKYVDAWMCFKRDVSLEVVSAEQLVYRPAHGYCGRLDRVARMHGGPSQFVLDIKTGGPADWHRLQTAAYAGCLPGFYRRATVHLGSDGRYAYAFREHKLSESMRDWADFQACLRVFELKGWKA
jgi:hypothetical protein